MPTTQRSLTAAPPPPPPAAKQPSLTAAPPPPPSLTAAPPPPAGPTPQRSLSAAPAALRPAKKRSLPTAEEEAWRRRGELHRSDRLGVRRSVTDDDFDELRGCLELGFSFDGIDFEKEESRKIARLLPALELFYGRAACDSPSGSSSSSDASPVHSAVSITSPGDSAETVKARLIQWSKVAALLANQKDLIEAAEIRVAADADRF